ncbi:amino acid adenylation domain-containing protein [Micromonospora sp. NPDC023644]|uniref:amino acid adenylation domain-containing protein n=1 Tax=Micromonospora sp. NPDC023644 TaxID=3154321 RepID=UPI0033F695A6
MGLSHRIPLTAYQSELWFASSLYPDLPQFNTLVYERLTGKLDLPLLKACVERVVRRNDGLRLRFDEANGAPYQWVEEDVPEIEVVDLSGERDPRQACLSWMRRPFSRAYSLKRARMFDVALLKESESSVYVYLNVHHLVCDGWGIYLLISQIRAEYQQEPANRAPSYVDFVTEAGRYLNSDERAADIAFYRKELAGVQPALFTRKAPGGSYRTGRHTFTVERARTGEYGSMFTIVAAALTIYLSRIHRTGDVVIGVPLLNRRTDAERNTVGHFANAMPLRMNTTGRETFRELVTRLRGSTRAMRAHERLPAGELLRELRPSDSGPRHLFDVTLSSMRWPSSAEIPGVVRETMVYGHAHETDALAIVVNEFTQDGPVVIDIDYAADVFDDDFPIESLAGHLTTLIGNALDAPDAPVSSLAMLAPAEHARLVQAANPARTGYPRHQTLSGLFEEQAARTPDRLAVVTGALTYAELDARANRVARVLRKEGIRPDDRVAVLIERDATMLTAILGVLKAGGAYVPIDPSYPADRIRFLIEDSGAKVVLVSGATKPPTVDAAVCDVDALAGSRAPVEPVATADNLAYVIYTSGSTGKPKGVMVEHHSVVNRLAWMQRRYPIGGADVLLQKTPISFDVSVWELFWWTIAGAGLALPPADVEKDPEAILGAIAAHGVTVIHFVPSMLGPFLDLIERSPRLRDSAGTLRLVFCSGEELTPGRVEQFTRVFGDGGPKLVNLYGPTEATVDVSAFDCPPGPVFRVPIGRPIDNIRLYVLGRHGEAQPGGVAGELCVAGAGVARGYLDRPELTGERFVEDPFHPGERMYRTGDLARWLADGNLEFLGRIDGQVKIRGNRVELGEVRDSLATFPGLRDAIVIDHRSEARGTYLVGYYVASDEVDPARLRTHLANTLPEFMIPAFFVRLDRTPLTPNGKLDRSALPSPAAVDVPDEPPRTEIEAALAAIWSDVLGLERVGIHRNYYTIGGDSILALRVRAEAEKRGLYFELADMVRYPTIAALAHRVSTETPADSIPDLVPFQLVSSVDRSRLSGVEDAYPATQLQLGLLYHGAEHEGSAVYHDVFRYKVRMPWREEPLREAFDRLVERHPVLRSSFDLGSFSEPLQLIHPQARGELEIADLRAAGEDAAEAEVTAHIEQRCRHRYEFDRAPLYLIRAYVRQSAVDLVFSFHHVILDGWSVATLISELLRDYLHLSGVDIEPVPTAALPSAAAYVIEERRTIESAVSRRFWREALEGAELTQLDGFRQYEPPGDDQLNTRWVSLPDGLDTRVRQFSKSHELPVKSVLLAAHCLTLRLLSGTDDVTTGLVMHGRPERPGAESITGLFLNTVPLRVGPTSDTWLEVVGQVYRQEREIHPHRRYPLHAIQNDRGGAPVLETVFNYVHMHVLTPIFELPGVELLDFQTREETNFTLLLNVVVSPTDGHISLRVDTDGRTITPAQTDLLIDYCLAILRRIVDDPHGAVDFAFLADPPAKPLPAIEPPSDIVRRLESHVARTPDAIAVAHGTERWTYAEFDRIVNRVAWRLVSLGAGPGTCVGIAMDRSPEMIATIYGIARSGAACVPIDVTYPQERITAMIEQAAPVRIVARGPRAGLIADPALLVTWESIEEDVDPVALPAIHPESLVFILFTSGSTGTPKGVAQLHRALDNYQAWQTNVPSGAVGGTTLQFAPLSFDVSIQEIYTTISGGGTLRIIDEEQRRDMPSLLRLLDREGVERIFLPYVALQQLAEAAIMLGIVPSKLRVVISSGEQLRVTAEIRQFMAALPGAILENQYGPTETHLVTAYPLAGDPAEFPNLPPIGPVINGVELYLLDERLRPVPHGVLGELYFGGIALADGYYGQPELTAQRFVANPFGEPGSRLYRTGDLARVLPNGDLVWARRTDTQTKIRGYRVEPLEVEIAIMALAQRFPGIREAAVVARRRDGADSFLAAFLVGDAGAVDLNEVRALLRESLPDHLVPSHITWLDRMPLTPSGKRDDAELRRIPLAAVSAAEQVAPRDAYERSLVEILTELLHLPSLGVHDNFFEVGGTSLTAMRLVVVLEKRFKVSVPLSALVTTPTVAGLAALLRSGGASLTYDPLVPIRAGGDRSPLFLVHPLGGNVLCYVRLAKHLPAEQPVYGLQAAGSDPGSEPLGSVPELARSYLEAIRRVQPSGPYRIGGWSFGGVVALELARQLRREDPAGVEQVILLDPIARGPSKRDPVADNALLEWFFWELIWLERSGNAPVEAIPDGLTEEEKFDFIMARATAAGVLRPGSSRASVRRLFRMFSAHWEALMAYEPGVLDQDLTLVRASDRLPMVLLPMHTAAGTLHTDPANGWARHTSGRIDVIDVPGNHLVLMEEPYVAEVARRIAEALDSREKAA